MATWFPASVYLLCFVTSAACALLLARSYRRTGARLLFWSALCFLFLAANNLVVIFDLLLLPKADFRLARYLLALAALGVLLFGFIWDLEE
jgi:cytochrome b subunit of formate dehydrogenase